MIKSTIKKIVSENSPIYRMISGLYNHWRPTLIDMEDLLQQISKNYPDLTICQVGANDGKSGDPLAMLLRSNQWKGILIEPLTQMFKLLKANTKDISDRFHLMNCAVDKTSGERSIFEIDYQDWMPAYYKELASFSTEHLPEVFQNKEIEPYIVQTQIKTEHIDGILSQTEFDRIDAYFIDTEGYDYEVIKLIDLEHHQPDIIFFEHVHLPIADYKTCLRTLKKNGYQLYYQHRDTIALSDRIRVTKVGVSL